MVRYFLLYNRRTFPLEKLAGNRIAPCSNVQKNTIVACC